MDLLTQFAVEVTAGLIGVFTGVVLALWSERKRKAREDREDRERLKEELARSRSLVLSSVVKNTSEAKRLATLLDGDSDPYLFDASFELAVWEAVQSQFVQLAGLDERVLLTRFFDQVRRLMGLIDFHREIRARLELRQVAMDAGDEALLADVISRLRLVADEMRIDGIVIITDLGEPLHKRLLGMADVKAPAMAS